MLLQEIRQLKTDPRTLRHFGVGVGAVLMLIGLGCWLAARKPSWPYVAAPGLALTVLGVVRPTCLRAVYRGWMTLGLVLGAIVSTVLLTVVFYLVATPLGLLARCLGRDFLSRKRDAQAATYWRPRPKPAPPPERYEQQF
jgi:hypothetical protein